MRPGLRKERLTMKTPIFTGSGLAMITPMHADGSVNYAEIDRIVEDQIAAIPTPSSAAAPPAKLPPWRTRSIWTLSATWSSG